MNHMRMEVAHSQLFPRERLGLLIEGTNCSIVVYMQALVVRPNVQLPRNLQCGGLVRRMLHLQALLNWILLSTRRTDLKRLVVVVKVVD